MEEFYTYLWLREDGTPYYVGKGKGYRAYNNDGHRVKKPTENSRIIVQLFESQEDAFFAEKFLIVLYGRMSLGTGCLANLTDGGEGVAGISQETIEKKRAARNKLWEDPEFRENFITSVRGRKYSQEGIEGRREAQLILWQNPEYKAMQTEAHKHPWTDKRKEAFKGVSAETRERMSNSQKKRLSDPEELAKHSARLKAYHSTLPVRMADCHPDRVHYVKGMCRACYEKDRRTQKKQKGDSV